tara:strand:- start:777 stop:1553 length:777 start_codon:yes stop_codon:yes gene_type:complete
MILKLIFIYNFFLGYSLTNDISWGKTGHRVVGEVASKYISKNTRTSLDKILGGQSLAYISTYADEIKSDKKYSKYNVWHYANLNLNETYRSSYKNPNGDVVKAIKTSIEILKSKSSTNNEKQFFLKLLVHFVGDLHQPLHLGKKEDRGGNDIDILWFGKKSNLHRLWDSDIIDSSKFSFTELSQNLPAISLEKRKKITSSSIDSWIQETHAFTQKIYMELPENKNLGYKYSYENFKIIRCQLLKAGLRLAFILDDIFK